MPDEAHTRPSVEGVASILDTDLYKLTMQCAVLANFPDANVTYHITNRTPNMRLTRKAFNWVREQVDKLKDLKLTAEEGQFLKYRVNRLPHTYLEYLASFTFDPEKEVRLTFSGGEGDDDQGEIEIEIEGLWVRTILYEIPLLAIVSEAYFKFVDTDWDLSGQLEKAHVKGEELLIAGCSFSEFGTRRRRSYAAQALVMQGLMEAKRSYEGKDGAKGVFRGTSNVHLARLFGVDPIGTVAHEWTMGIAAYTNDYKRANELGLEYWTKTFTPGNLSIALTDTFGTEDFLKAFAKPCPFLPGTHIEDSAVSAAPGLLDRNPDHEFRSSYAEIWEGVRQDSGDPAAFVKTMREFYDKLGVDQAKTIVFSDSLNVERCKELKALAEAQGFLTSFGIGTDLTNDFVRKSDGQRSKPLNIVIKIATVNGRPAVKLSDDMGKNTGDPEEVKRAKEELGYVEKEWHADETSRWGGK